MITKRLETVGCGNAPVPVPRAILPPAAAAEEDDKDEVVVTDE